MTRKLELNVEGNSGDGIRALAAAAAEVDHLARQADKLGDQFRQAARDAELLDAEMAKTAVEAKLLAREFATSDVETRDSIRQKIAANRTAASELRKIRGEIIGDTERDAKAATAFWRKASNDLSKLSQAALSDVEGLGQSIIDTASKIPLLGGLLDNPAGLLGGVAVATTLGPPLISGAGATLGGLGIGAAAAGTTALGIAGVKDNAQVERAWTTTIQHIKAQWLDASKPFVGPTVEAAKQVEASFSRIHLEQALAKSATYVQPLVTGATGFAEHVIAGVEELSNKAGPVVSVLRDELPGLGKDIETSFKLIAGGNKGAADGLRDTIHGVGELIIVLGGVIRATEDIYHFFVSMRETGAEWVHTVRESVPVLGNVLALTDQITSAYRKPEEQIATKLAVNDATYQFNGLAVAVYNTADAARDLDTAFRAAFDPLLNLDQANVQAEIGFRTMAETIKRNKGALDDHSAAGLADAQTILQQIGVLEQQRQAAIKAGDGTKEGTEKANGAFLTQLQRLRDIAVKAGVSTTAIDNLISKYEDLANAPDVSKSIVVHYKTVFTTTGPIEVGPGHAGPGRQRYGGVVRAAEGMIVPPSNPGTVLFGEPPTGGELFLPLKGAHNPAGLINTAAAAYGLSVIPTPQRARAAAQRWTGPGTSRPATTTSYTPQGLEALFMSWMLKQVQEGTLPLALA